MRMSPIFLMEKKKPCSRRNANINSLIKPKNTFIYPCMSAPEITKQALKSLRDNPADFYLINYANADMVAHSGF